MMKKSIDEFFEENDVRVGKDFQTTPPIYYQSLTEGMFGYFNSILTLKFKYNLLFNTNIRDRKSMAFNFNDSDSTVSCLLGLHRFFELLLKDLLARVNPFYAVKFLENEKQQVAFFNNALDPEKVNTIEFSEAHKRFKALFADETADVSKIERFKFLIEDDTLALFARWRNRIIHNGKTLPNLFALDYLVTQKALPLIERILLAEKDTLKGYYPHFLKTPSGIDILSEFRKIEFDYKDFYPTSDEESKALVRKLFQIGHIKELARASFYFDRHITERNISFQEPYYENPKEKLNRLAKAEEKNEFYFDTKECLSCGVNSLIIYKKIVDDDLFTKKLLDYYYCRCTSCDYFFSENFADPYILGFSKERIFPLH